MKCSITALVWLICTMVACPSSNLTATRLRLDRRYYNDNYHFCVYFPPDWSHDEPFTRNGVRFAPKKIGSYIVTPIITVGARANQPSESEDRQQTLSENIQTVIDGLREEGSAKDLVVVKRENLFLQHLPAIAITLRYRDDKSNEEWFDKDVNLLTKNGIVYFLELKGNPRDATQLEVIFDAMVRSLRLGCKA